MKNEKGDNAFESVDDVLADEIVSRSASHGRHTESDSGASAPEESDDGQAQDPEPIKNNRTRTIIIAACIALGLLILGVLCFVGCKKYCTR